VGMLFLALYVINEVMMDGIDLMLDSMFAWVRGGG